MTLLGDAAHVTTPFTGTGVNIAMHDSYALSVALRKVAFEGAAIDEVLDEYEKVILERAAFGVTNAQRIRAYGSVGGPFQRS